jgi:hypothetical protein
MIYLALFFVMANLLFGEFSMTGRRLELSQHPLVLRLRWLSIGMVLALVLSGYKWEKTGWVGWATVAILLFSSARHFAPTSARKTVSSNDSASKPIA